MAPEHPDVAGTQPQVTKHVTSTLSLHKHLLFLEIKRNGIIERLEMRQRRWCNTEEKKTNSKGRKSHSFKR